MGLINFIDLSGNGLLRVKKLSAGKNFSGNQHNVTALLLAEEEFCADPQLFILITSAPAVGLWHTSHWAESSRINRNLIIQRPGTAVLRPGSRSSGSKLLKNCSKIAQKVVKISQNQSKRVKICQICSNCSKVAQKLVKFPRYDQKIKSSRKKTAPIWPLDTLVEYLSARGYFSLACLPATL